MEFAAGERNSSMEGIIRINDVFSIRNIAGRGRCVIANRDLEPGTVVLQEEPYAHVVSQGFMEVTCFHCCKLCINSTICAISADDPIRYCSEQCMKADFGYHMFEAHAVKAVLAKGIGGSFDSIRLILRIAAVRAQSIMAKRESIEDDTTSSASNEHTTIPKIGKLNLFANAYCLEGRSDNLNGSELDDLRAVSSFLSTAIDDGIAASIKSTAMRQKFANLLSSEEILHLFLAIQGNAHQIVTPMSRRCIGLGLFPMASMLNHSCYPNCSHNFVLPYNGNSTCNSTSIPQLVMKTNRFVSEGDELCFSYIPLYSSTVTRRNKLLKAYSFLCDCCRCNRDLSLYSFPTEDEDCKLDRAVAVEEQLESYSDFVADLQLLSQHIQGYEDFNDERHLSICQGNSSSSSISSSSSSVNITCLLGEAASTILSLTHQIVNKWILSPVMKHKEYVSSLGVSHPLMMSFHSSICKAMAISAAHMEVDQRGHYVELFVVGLRCGQLALGTIIKFTGLIRMKETGIIECCLQAIWKIIADISPVAPKIEDRNRDIRTSLAEAVLESIQQQQDEEFTTPPLLDVSEDEVRDVYRCSTYLAEEVFLGRCRGAESIALTTEITGLWWLAYFQRSAEYSMNINNSSLL